jgi:hypothetical protein
MQVNMGYKVNSILMLVEVRVNSSIFPNVQFLHPKEEAKYYLRIMDQILTHLARPNSDNAQVIELKGKLEQLRIRAEESPEDAKDVSEVCIQMIKSALDIVNSSKEAVKPETIPPEELVRQRIESIKKKKQNFDQQFQALWNLEATWENRAKVMEIMGVNRELNSELEFLETLRKRLP